MLGGTLAKPGQWPDAVAVLSDTTACTGTLIAPDLVLTAGHCIDPAPIYVVVDTLDYSKPGGEAIRVKTALAYPSWEDAYDVGVVVLDHPAKAAPRVVAAGCTARDGLVVGAALHLVGFGLTTQAGTGDNSRLHHGFVPVLDPLCSLAGACMPGISPGGEFIAGGRGVDSCFGDSGGPVYLDTPGGPALVGVVSRGFAMDGPPCGQGGVYVRADKVVAWIERVTHKTIRRTTCRGAADQASQVEAGEPESSGCSAAGGPGGTLVIALGVLVVAGLYRRRRRAQSP